jgi:hypothetical protein
VELSEAQRTDVWRRWKAGESLHTIGRALDRPHTSRHCLSAHHDGIVPAVRRRSVLALTLFERGAGEDVRPDSQGFGLSFGRGLVASLLATINRLLGKAFSQPNSVRVFWLQRQQPSQAKSKTVAGIPRWPGRVGLFSYWTGNRARPRPLLPSAGFFPPNRHPIPVKSIVTIPCSPSYIGFTPSA